MGHHRIRTPKSNDVFLLLPDKIQRTVAMIRALNAAAVAPIQVLDRQSNTLNEFMNRNMAIVRDERGLAEAMGRLAFIIERASIALQIQLMDNGQTNPNITGINPFPIETPNLRINLDPGVAEAMRLARRTRFFAQEILRAATLLYRQANKLQDQTPVFERLSEAKKGAYAQTQPGYYVVKGHTDARDGSTQTERLPDIAERLFGRRDHWQLIAEHNEIKYPYELTVGQVLEIPDLLVPQSERLLFAGDDARFQTLLRTLRSLRFTMDGIPATIIAQFPEYETVLAPEGVRPNRILYRRINPLGTDWYLDSAHDPVRGYSGRTKDLVETDTGQVAQRSGIDSFMLGMRRLFATQKGHVPLRREYGHEYEELVGAGNARLQLVLARVYTFQLLSQESDRIDRVTDVITSREIDHIPIKVTLAPKGFVNDFLITVPIPELGARGQRVVNRPIPLPAPEELRD